jgi:DNA-binding MarR family transcriptional regulator
MIHAPPPREARAAFAPPRGLDRTDRDCAEAGLFLGRYGSQFLREVEGVLRGHDDLSFQGFLVLRLIEDRGKAFPSELALALGVDRAQSSRTSRILEQRALIERRYEGRDRRRRALFLTDKARALLDRIGPEFAGFTRGFLQRIEAAEGPAPAIAERHVRSA